MIKQMTYGGVPVPYTASWTAEEGPMSIARCPYARRPAVFQPVDRGNGKPRFGSPHMQRQREVIAMELCDLCARPLKNRTKVSLSHARPRGMGAGGFAILQVEPLLHRECAAISLEHCPSLKRDVRDGSLNVRQVNRFQVQFAIMDEVYTQQQTGQSIKAVGHAKVDLLAWVDRHEGWLTRGAP